MDIARYAGLLPYLTDLYGAEAGANLLEELARHLERFALEMEQGGVPSSSPLTHRDTLLITYPDQISEPDVPPLATLANFNETYLVGLIQDLHLLPFYPSSSDDGFSVIDYHSVDPALGSWEDVSRLARRFRLMADGVINHISRQSAWFRGFLQDDPRYRDYFISVPPGTNLSQVVRPRALPLLTRFQTAAGEKQVWTTFSPDQIDLNYHNPQVLLEIIDVLLLYVAKGAQAIRLDAIAYLWKEPGTTSIHLPQTHTIIRLLRAILDLAAPSVLLVTETNVPHRENIAYFGNGQDEAQLVYNFALPPLVLHALLTGQAGTLSEWAAGLALPSSQVTFLNFLASHDGVGLNPVRDILAPAEIQGLVSKVVQHGGLVSYKAEPGGGQSPYELNISYFDALSDPQASEPLARQVDRFMAAQAILLAMVGIPGIYVHSLLGSRSWRQGVQQTGRSRTINRQKFERAALEAELNDAASLRAQVFQRYSRLLVARAGGPAFDPFGTQVVLPLGESIFGLLRFAAHVEHAESAGGPILCLHNLSDQPQPLTLDMEGLGFAPRMWNDLVSGQTFVLGKHPSLRMQPYQVLWLA